MTNIEENKKELKKKIDDIKGLIKANSKDVHYADTLISELLSLHKELKHEPTLVHIPMDSISKTFKDDTYELCYTKQGEAVYRTFGGYTIICSSIFNALNSTISTMIDYLNGDVDTQELTEYEKEMIEYDYSVSTLLFHLPLHACDNLDFKFKLRDLFEEYITNLQKKANTDEPQEETVEEDKQFAEAMKGIEEVREIIGEEVKKIKEK